MWQGIIDYFQTLEQRPVERMVVLVGGLLFFWILEGSIPFLQLQYKKNKVRHAMVNFGFTIIHLIIHTFLAIIIILLADWCRQNEFGLVYWFNLGIAGIIILSFLFLDFFGGWLVHYTEHQLPLLWRFHTVHHADNNVDVTTGLRHHPLESVLRGLFFLAAIFLTGAPMYAVMIFQTLLIIATGFTHANIRLPKKVDAAVSLLFVSPAMHKVHHHWKQPFTDSNYGAVLSVWDRLFGTYRKLDASEIKYGLDRHYPNDQDENFMMLMLKPFSKKRY